MKIKKYVKDINQIEVTGEIRNLPDFVRYIQTDGEIRPLISFDLYCYRKKKTEEEEKKCDILKIVLFDNEHFLKNAKEGDRFRFIGEIQSRNYNRISEEEPDELYVAAVQNYYAITKQYPCQEQPTVKKKQPVDWRILMEFGGGLIPEPPKDSMYDENMEKNKSPETPYIYLIDKDGQLTKETQHVTYEILVSEEPEKLEEPLDELKGDTNKVIMCGKVTKQPFVTIIGNEKPVPLVSFNCGTQSEFFKGRTFYNNVIAWGSLAEEISKHIKEGDYVFLKGRLQSRSYTKKIRKRWVTPSGNKKKKDIEISLLTREISVSYIEKRISG